MGEETQQWPDLVVNPECPESVLQAFIVFADHIRNLQAANRILATHVIAMGIELSQDQAKAFRDLVFEEVAAERNAGNPGPALDKIEELLIESLGRPETKLRLVSSRPDVNPV